MMKKSMKNLTKTVVSMLALMMAPWMIGCQDQDEGSSATAIEAQALQACLADEPCKDCYEQCMDENADKDACRDGCCRSHGGDRVHAYCEEHGDACRAEGRRESCEAHEKRCPNGGRPDGGVGRRGGNHDDSGGMTDSDRGGSHSKTDTDLDG